jgi:hypothetical protein
MCNRDVGHMAKVREEEREEIWAQEEAREVARRRKVTAQLESSPSILYQLCISRYAKTILFVSSANAGTPEKPTRSLIRIHRQEALRESLARGIAGGRMVALVVSLLKSGDLWLLLQRRLRRVVLRGGEGHAERDWSCSVRIHSLAEIELNCV